MWRSRECEAAEATQSALSECPLMTTWHSNDGVPWAHPLKRRYNRFSVLSLLFFAPLTPHHFVLECVSEQTEHSCSRKLCHSSSSRRQKQAISSTSSSSSSSSKRASNEWHSAMRLIKLILSAIAGSRTASFASLSLLLLQASKAVARLSLTRNASAVGGRMMEKDWSSSRSSSSSSCCRRRRR